MTMLCEISEMVVDRFAKIDIYCKCDWYLFPSTVRRMLPTIIANSDSVVVKGFGDVSFTRDLLKRVISTLEIKEKTHKVDIFSLNFRWSTVDLNTS